MAFVDTTSFNKETQTKSVICDLPISFHFLKTLHLDGWLTETKSGNLCIPRRWRPDQVLYLSFTGPIFTKLACNVIFFIYLCTRQTWMLYSPNLQE